MAFTDLVGGYLQNRMDQATQPFTDPSGYMQNRIDNAFPGTETPEERRRRLEREAAERGNTEIGSTTIKSYADGSQEEVKKTQIPAPVAPVPVAPAPAATPVAQAPVTAPVPAAPNTYQRMIQAESGGQNYNASGQPLTSPAGAMFAAQVMPSTAANPGYGVRPAQAQTPEEYNRVGQEYYQAMLKQFGGDEQKAIAAYNAGPGRVQQNLQANAGQLNVGQLPQETQQYLQRVQAPVAPVAVAQQPAPTTQPIATTAGPVNPAAPAPVMIAGTPSSDVGLTPTEQAIKQQPPQWHADLLSAQNDLDQLYTIAGDKTGRYPAEVKEIARSQAIEQDRKLMESRRAEQIAKGAATGDPKAQNDLLKAIKTKSEEGSYVKAYLFSRLGLNDLAREEQDKLAGPKFGQALVDGKSYVVEAKNGVVVGAYTDTGARVTSDAELAKINATYINPTKSSTGAEVFYNPMVPNSARFAKVDTPTGATFRELGTGRAPTAQEQAGLVKMSSAGPLEQQYAAAFLKGGGSKQGQQAAEGYTNAPLPAPPGTAMPGAPAVAGSPAVSAAPAPSINPAIPNPNVPSPVVAGGPVYQQKQASEIGGKRTEAFNKIIDTEYREGAANGEVVVENRKKQYDILNRIDPSTGKGMAETISGLYNAANEDPTNQKLTIIRDILTGKVGKNEDEISQRIAQLNISPAAKSALQEYSALNAQISGRTLRETAGPGAVSDAEQAANRARNVDITKAPMLGAYNMMGQSQFSGDIQRYKSDLAATTTAPSATSFDRDFRKTQAELVKSYREVTEARLDYINKNGGANNPAAIREGYKRFPVPEYDVNSGNWRYLKPLSSYNR